MQLVSILMQVILAFVLYILQAVDIIFTPISIIIISTIKAKPFPIDKKRNFILNLVKYKIQYQSVFFYFIVFSASLKVYSKQQQNCLFIIQLVWNTFRHHLIAKQFFVAVIHIQFLYYVCVCVLTVFVLDSYIYVRISTGLK